MYKFTKMVTVKNEIHSTQNARNFKNYEGRNKTRESIILEGYLCYNLWKLKMVSEENI